ncbi:hypothetical protein Tco_1202406 [Tanacetum coccineum]
MSPIHTFPIEDMYTPEFLDFFQQNIGSFQETARKDSPVEVSAPPPNSKSKPTRGRQKRTVQNENAPGRLHGQTRKTLRCVNVGFTYSKTTDLVTRGRMLDFRGFLQYIESKPKMYGRRTYDMVNGKWKTVRPNVVRFCGVYSSIMRRLQESGAGDEDYYNRLLLDYEAETGVPFKLRHCWEVLKGSPKWMETKVLKFLAKSGEGSGKRYKKSGSSSFNTESGKASINLNVNVCDDEEDEVQVTNWQGQRERLYEEDRAESIGIVKYE